MSEKEIKTEKDLKKIDNFNIKRKNSRSQEKSKNKELYDRNNSVQNHKKNDISCNRSV